MGASDLVRIARSQIGIKEYPRNSNRVKYSKWYGLTGPWCDMFVSWCAAQIGASGIIGKYAYCPYHVQYFKKKGWWLPPSAKPQSGDIIFFAHHGTACHVGIVEKRIDSARVQTIEGNTSTSSNDNGGKVMCRVRTYGNPHGSWGILGFARPVYGGRATTTASHARGYLKQGDKGAAVKTLQQRLITLGYSCGKAGTDGEYGPATVNAVKIFQMRQQLEVDGIAGVNTIARLNALYSAKTSTKAVKKGSWVARLQTECNRQGFSHQTVDGVPGAKTLAGCPTLHIGDRGDITKLLQEKLGIAADGIFGKNTQAAVRKYQRSKGLTADGVVGKKTWRKLLGL